MTVLVYILH